MKREAGAMKKADIQRYGHKKSARKALTMTALKNYFGGSLNLLPIIYIIGTGCKDS
ncbi:MAG: hypothetical protein LBS12_04625 [Prevotellaceae bacterium]|jgi:hypothetical protein|nr:hypothetical protein [Prevotellaceae bacterium]